ALFARLAYADPSPVVRKYLAAALQRLEPASRREVARGLLTRAEDAEDPNIPRLVWYGVEPLVAADASALLALAGESGIPLVGELIARRAIDADSVDAVVTAL